MNRWVTALLLVLVIQWGITAVVFWPLPASQQQDALQPFKSIAIDAIEELRISDEFDNEAVLVRSAEQWILPDLEHLPADVERVEALLHSLTRQPANWPIADSSAARQRFQVADYYYQKRLTFLSRDKTLDTLYLGTSPGFRKVHARYQNEDAIYSIDLNTVEVPAVNDSWLERKLLQIRAPLRIDTDLYNLYFEDGRWMSATGGDPDEVQLNTLIAALKDLQVDGVAGPDLQRTLSTVEAGLVLTITSLAGSVTLELVTLDGQHYIHSTEFPLFFKCSAFDFDRLTGIDASLIAGEVTGESHSQPPSRDL